MSAEQYGAYSVLMSVYSKENPAWLKLAIESMQTQTLPTSDFVLVCDGPLTPELDGVIAEKRRQMGETLTVVRLEKNMGLGILMLLGGIKGVECSFGKEDTAESERGF